MESGRSLPIEWTLAAVEETKKERLRHRQLQRTHYFEDPAVWTQDGAWWIHKGAGVGWMRRNQGVYVIEFLAAEFQDRTVIKRTRHVEWVVDQKDATNRIEYSFDFGTLERRVIVDGKTETKR